MLKEIRLVSRCNLTHGHLYQILYYLLLSSTWYIHSVLLYIVETDSTHFLNLTARHNISKFYIISEGILQKQNQKKCLNFVKWYLLYFLGILHYKLIWIEYISYWIPPHQHYVIWGSVCLVFPKCFIYNMSFFGHPTSCYMRVCLYYLWHYQLKHNHLTYKH